ncbi:MAG: FkbM family methyltransferase [Gammaproteobacteria bacterium]|nr:FkbM family methyltransferase [Gammaproteobacteria bacterium]MCK5262548.1 FkbM family methyltransferase [Gammaproteobacteria bacterium]
MNHKLDNTLFNKLKQKGFSPTHAAEVGVYYPETSNIYNFIVNDIRSTLIEPDPDSIKRIKEHFSDRKNIELHTVALCDFTGSLDLVQRGASTFSSALSSSPSIINDGYTVQEGDKFTVEATTFDQIDDGSIDLLSIDIEGGEWFVIKHMKSRPAVVSIETHGAAYINPYIDEIRNWMDINGYTPWYKDNTDTVYVLKNIISPDTNDRIMLFLKNLHLPFRRGIKKLKLFLKSLFK